MTTSSTKAGFWPDVARLAISLSMQFEAAGVRFLRKDEIARWALAQPDTPREA